jgi:hypothetical protein
MRITTPQKSTFPVEALRGAGTDGGVADTAPSRISPASGHGP